MLMFAYGMNTNVSEMTNRCPGAVSLGHARLINHVFRFAYHADVEACEGSYVDGVLWEIDQAQLQALDQLEGYPHYYDRSALTVMHQARACQALTYRMQPGHADTAPSDRYFDLVLEGYQQHNVPAEQLYNSLVLQY
jgi:gamma-glutamylcyclotransferase (GGCT)/AIG2-like uncharacterized protein YtfP